MLEKYFTLTKILPWLKLLGFLITLYLSYFIPKKIVLRWIHHLFEKSKNKIDDFVIKNKIIETLVLIIPGVLVYYFFDFVSIAYKVYAKKISIVYIEIILIVFISKFLNLCNDIYNTFPISKDRPIKGYIQLLKIFIYIMGAIFVGAYILDRSPWGIISGVGALTAIIMIIFKDTILSFVASLQINTYGLLRVGDWIEMPSFGVDGDVIDISLHVVKIQNFDKTIVTVPTYKFLESSFKNWRGMYEAGARRIKRAIPIDQSSVRFLAPEEIEKLKRVSLLSDYLRKKEEELTKANQSRKDQIVLNGRYLTNLGTYRAYVYNYLLNHPRVVKDLTLLVRHLSPQADKGIPLEIYCFVNEIRWAEYEALQADIFDHLLAALPFFGLKAYQRNALVDRRDEVAQVIFEWPDSGK